MAHKSVQNVSTFQNWPPNISEVHIEIKKSVCWGNACYDQVTKMYASSSFQNTKENKFTSLVHGSETWA